MISNMVIMSFLVVLVVSGNPPKRWRHALWWIVKNRDLVARSESFFVVKPFFQSLRSPL